MIRLLRQDSEKNIYQNTKSDRTAKRGRHCAPVINPRLHSPFSRVVTLTEEVPREFPVWVCRHITDYPAGEFAKPKDWLPEVFGTLKGLLEMGREMVGMSDADATEHLMSNTESQFLARIPSVDKYRDVQFMKF